MFYNETTTCEMIIKNCKVRDFRGTHFVSIGNLGKKDCDVKMRVLMINEECGTGSIGRICVDIAAALEENGNTVKIAFGRNESLMPEKCAKYAIRIGNNVDLCIHGIISRIFDAKRFDIVKATRELIQWIKKYNPDIMHLYNLHGYYINIELLFNYLKQ